MMDRSPGQLPTTCSRLIAMAVSIVGDAEAVRREMGCPDEDFRDYCAAVKEPSFPELDRLIALIVREQSRMIARNRELIAQFQSKLPKNG